MKTKSAYLFDRNGTYYCRVRVPQSLIAVIGKKEIWRSLETESYQTAKQLAVHAARDIIRNMQSLSRKLTDKDIPLIAENYRLSLMAGFESKRLLIAELPDNTRQSSIAAEKIGIAGLMEDARQAVAASNYKEGIVIADKRISSLLGRVAIDKSSKTYKLLCLALLSASVNAY